ncbi:MAG: translational GTPase TypA [Candidatus Nitrohelix vancouverensis]|uniref:Large ribosomal subunit assembly factor BipA n=1 Tax=Candidatus Nitrohelix vancouverensis TaxID=2705534 RepID=A0A7T0C3J8_9BACT|nr:MAG: translational GTPase TypA [Candidatus Nitrohelix vancouverensis]
MQQQFIRNIGIIAHVDHGKTTLVDCLLKRSGMFRDSELAMTCVLDSNDLERERGITIFSKNASIYHDNHKINIVDTPGHADFGGEVERILKMVNGVLLIVDAAEGPMPQTRFVLKKSLDLGLHPIVVINKIDRQGADPDHALDQVFELFVNLGATDEQLDFPVLYASAKQGICRTEPNGPDQDMTPLLDLIVEKVKPHAGEESEPFQMLVSSIDYNDYIGRIAIGKVQRGKLSAKDPLTLINRDGKHLDFKISKMFTYEGLKRIEADQLVTGDIVGISGMKDIDIGETLAHADCPEALPVLTIDEPTLSINIMANSSPFAGREGKFVTSRQLRDRLYKETKSNVAMRVSDTKAADAFKVSGRGELHLSILIETMRREGYEFSVSRPEVVLKEINGKIMEPEELVVIDVDEEYMGGVMEEMGKRKGNLINIINAGSGSSRLEYHIPTRGLFGFRSPFLTLTKGTGVLNNSFHQYVPHCGEIARRQNGVLIALENGTTTGYSLYNLQERGTMFLKPGQEVYIGMIIGENNKDNDLIVNACKEKKLTNMRASGSDENISLSPPRVMSLEQTLGYLNEDELAEITPQSIRLRKRFLDENERKRSSKSQKVA